uniref:Uncharacterized protein n=1 Tax=Oryza nivara TaxID=4536 RepID=A0A0E0GJX1_ORYNI
MKMMTCGAPLFLCVNYMLVPRIFVFVFILKCHISDTSTTRRTETGSTLPRKRYVSQNRF